MLDLPDLVPKFERWRADELTSPALLVVGGGDAADAVRAFDARFSMGESKAHWLAMRAMLFNAHLVASVLREAAIVSCPAECSSAWARGQLAVANAVAWMQNEATSSLPGGIPHRWSFTSDSIAAHLAARLGATRLTLLKSTLPAPPDEPLSASTAGSKGVVDSDFDLAIRGATIGKQVSQIEAPLYEVQLVNLRSSPITRCRLI